MAGKTITTGKIDAVEETPLWWEPALLTIGNGRRFIFHRTLGKIKVQRPHWFKEGQSVKVVIEDNNIVSINNGILEASE